MNANTAGSPPTSRSSPDSSRTLVPSEPPMPAA